MVMLSSRLVAEILRRESSVSSSTLASTGSGGLLSTALVTMFKALGQILLQDTNNHD